MCKYIFKHLAKESKLHGARWSQRVQLEEKTCYHSISWRKGSFWGWVKCGSTQDTLGRIHSRDFENSRTYHRVCSMGSAIPGHTEGQGEVWVWTFARHWDSDLKRNLLLFLENLWYNRLLFIENLKKRKQTKQKTKNKTSLHGPTTKITDCLSKLKVPR